MRILSLRLMSGVGLFSLLGGFASTEPLRPEYQSAQDQALHAQIKLESTQVLVPVLAIGVLRDPQKPGRIFYKQGVQNLDKKEYFKIKDGGQRAMEKDRLVYRGGEEHAVSILYPEAQVPLRLGILVETDELTDRASPITREFIKQIITKRLRPQDAYFYATFSGPDITMRKEFAASEEQKKKDIIKGARWKGKQARFRDAVAHALDILDAKSEGVVKRVLLVIASNGESQDVSLVTMPQIIDRAKTSSTQITIVSTGNKLYQDPECKAPKDLPRKENLCRPGEWREGERLTDLTGGISYFIADDAAALSLGSTSMLEARTQIQEHLMDLFDSIMREVILGYELNPGEAQTNSWHEIWVEVNTTLKAIRSIKENGQFEDIELRYPRYVHLSH